jgi:hypothetical protein
MEIKTISTSTLFELLTFIWSYFNEIYITGCMVGTKARTNQLSQTFFPQIIKAARFQFTFGGAQEVAQMPDLVLAIPGWIETSDDRGGGVLALLNTSRRSLHRRGFLLITENVVSI